MSSTPFAESVTSLPLCLVFVYSNLLLQILLIYFHSVLCLPCLLYFLFIYHCYFSYSSVI